MLSRGRWATTDGTATAIARAAEEADGWDKHAVVGETLIYRAGNKADDFVVGMVCSCRSKAG